MIFMMFFFCDFSLFFIFLFFWILFVRAKKKVGRDTTKVFEFVKLILRP